MIKEVGRSLTHSLVFNVNGIRDAPRIKIITPSLLGHRWSRVCPFMRVNGLKKLNPRCVEPSMKLPTARVISCETELKTTSPRDEIIRIVAIGMATMLAGRNARGKEWK